MKKDVLSFLRKTVHDFFDGALNLFIFFPYFFSVSALFKTLFAPWKNIVTKKTGRGFSLTEWSGRLFFNLISRLIGAAMRSSILLFYAILQCLYVVLLPFIVILFFSVLPVLFIIFMIEKTEDEKKEMMKNAFLSTHLLRQGNKQAVVSWFESYYQNHLQKKDWWKLQNLLSIPPLARDWAVGYTPLLDEFTEDLTRAEYQNHIKNVVGRKKEIEQIENILIMNEEANVLIVGEEGVGKHAIVDALSKRIYEGQTNSILAYKRILKLNLEKILTTYVDQKQRESFLEDLFMEAAEARNVILLIENLDKYVAYDQGRIDLSIPMEKFGKTACIQFIGLTTPFFYQKFIFANDKINRIFSKLDVAEIPAAEAINTLLEVAHLYEQKNNVVIPYETILDVVDRSEFYITYIPFPEKAFNLLDMGCAYGNQKRFNIITPDIIDTVLSEKTHIPTRLSDSMRTKLIKLEKLLEERIVSQHEAIEKLAAAMRRSFIILGKRKKPLASFLFFGPTGVGKTETAKALSDIFFGSEKYLLRFDMSLYQTTGDIKTLIGSIESGMPGHLSKAIRENPYAVLLLDEIEKADKDLLNIFLTLIDEGYFTDGFGKKVDCKNLIVIATSNASPDFFLPEFLNRFDGVVTYNPVTEESVLMLAKKMTDSTKETIYKLYKIHVEITDSTLKNLIKKGYDQKYGARNLQRIIARELEDKIAKRILEKKVQEGDTISL
jgi:ATP-dependent Clp protease ATP-binding subunit ClpA